MKIYNHTITGKRPSNEDYHIIYDNNKNDTLIMGVFDGHGGNTISKFLKNNIINYINNEIDNKSLNKKNILKMYKQIDAHIVKEHPRSCFYTGSTACIFVYNYDNNNGIILNTGDSRAVLCDKNDKAIQISQDHKPILEREKFRINRLGGKIEYDGYDWRINGLSLSRAFGDISSYPYIISTPDIFTFKIKNNDKFLIIACDGLWDVLSNQDIVNYINILILQNKKYINYAKELTNYAYNNGSTDNITIQIIFFSN